MRKRNSLVLGFLVWSCGSEASGLTPVQQASIDQQIAERQATAPAGAPGVESVPEDLKKKIDEILTKVAAVADSLKESIVDLEQVIPVIDESIRRAKEAKLDKLPFEDEAWVASVRKEIEKLCCEVRTDPNRQKKIKQRVASGLSPLPGPNEAGRNAGADD